MTAILDINNIGVQSFYIQNFQCNLFLTLDFSPTVEEEVEDGNLALKTNLIPPTLNTVAENSETATGKQEDHDPLLVPPPFDAINIYQDENLQFIKNFLGQWPQQTTEEIPETTTYQPEEENTTVYEEDDQEDLEKQIEDLEKRLAVLKEQLSRRKRNKH